MSAPPQGAPAKPAPPATAYAWLSIAAGLPTLGLKFAAYLATGSVGLLSDAVESIVNLLAALIALWALVVARQPADEEHAFGHSKAEYFASGFAGLAILGAAIAIAMAKTQGIAAAVPTAWPRVEQVAMTRVELRAQCVVLMSRPAKNRLSTLREYRLR